MPGEDPTITLSKGSAAICSGKSIMRKETYILRIWGHRFQVGDDMQQQQNVMLTPLRGGHVRYEHMSVWCGLVSQGVYWVCRAVT